MNAEMLIASPLAVAIGAAIGTAYTWQTGRACLGLAIAAGIGAALGIPAVEVVIDCTGLGAGWGLAQRRRRS